MNNFSSWLSFWLIVFLVFRSSLLTLLVLVGIGFRFRLRLNDRLSLSIFDFGSLNVFGLLLNDLFFLVNLHCVGEVGRGLGKLIKLVSNSVVLLGNDTRVLLLKVDSEFIVDERNHHSVMEGDQVRGLVLSNLSERLHEDEGSITGEFILSLFSDEPSLVIGITDLSVVSTHSLQFDLDHSLHGAANGMVHLILRSFQDNFFLDEVLVFFR